MVQSFKNAGTEDIFNPKNRLEALSGDRKGQYNIRMNDRHRICFAWTEKAPDQVEIVEYH
jgi:toxin HigB-1